ncbi:MAG: hypothetical protein H0X30_29205 [Anaerolineae bacterium]|nr:hypothetical protein [Anaerolineae bacterium]
MSNSPSPLNGRNLTRAGVIGLVLAVLAIVLFLVLWVVLGSFKLDAMPRLFASLCVPPAVLAGIMGIYILTRKPKV